ncbi:hypothetical protein [Singulisphaera sp. PoT]|uniref:hypothetical protein n=1 Tax=Singulisphaera sp. PoT TaxID=3411797 RepID=UPI003BF46606
MNHPYLHRGLQTCLRRLLPAVVLVLACGWGSESIAASISKASRGDEGHSRYCRCGNRCREASCCCARRAEASSRPGSKPAAPNPFDPNPCIKDAPCGDPAVPGVATSGPLGKAVTFTLCGLLAAPVAGRFLPSDSRCLLPPRILSRIDDPPERGTVG